MKTQIGIKEDKFFWEQKKVPHKYDNKPFWVLKEGDGLIAILVESDSSCWQISDSDGLKIFDPEIRFNKVNSAQQYVENKFLKWIKNIISIRI